MAAASGKKLIQTVIHNTNTASQMQSMTARLVLGGTAMAAGAAYHIAELRKEIESANRNTEETRKEVESANKKAESAHKEAEKARHALEIQTKEMESMRREYDAKFESIKEIDRIRRECDAKLETTKSSWWSWFG